MQLKIEDRIKVRCKYKNTKLNTPQVVNKDTEPFNGDYISKVVPVSTAQIEQSSAFPSLQSQISGGGFDILAL